MINELNPEYDPALNDAYRYVYWAQVFILGGPALMLELVWYYGAHTDWTTEEAAYGLMALASTTVSSMTTYAFLGRLLSISEGALHIRVMKYWVPFTSWIVNLGTIGIAAYITDD